MSDTTAPTLTTISIASNNSIKTNYAGENDVVTLTLVADETLSTVNVTFKSGGQAVTNAVSYSSSGTTWTAQYTVSSSDTTGIVSFAITIEDSAFNSTTNLDSSTTTDSSSVTKVGSSSVTTTTTTETTFGTLLQQTYGTHSSAYFGAGLSISRDGNVFAISGTNHSANNIWAGIVIIWTRGDISVNNSNSVIGVLYGVDNSAEYGDNISLNDDGSIIAISTQKSDTDVGTATGHIEVKKYNETTDEWDQLGDEIIGGAANSWTGTVRLNGDGSILAQTVYFTYQLKIWQYSTPGVLGGEWTQLGGTIDQESSGDSMGTQNWQLALSQSGYIVAIGATSNDSAGQNYGHTRIYKYSTPGSTGGTWEPYGTNYEILGELLKEGSGISLSLTADGNTIAIGAQGNVQSQTNGNIRIYEYSDPGSTTGTWNKTHTIQGSSDEYLGACVSLNSDGTVLGCTNSTYAQIYQYDGSSWNKLGYNYTESRHIQISGDGAFAVVGDEWHESSSSYNNNGIGRLITTGIDNIVTTTRNFDFIPPDVTSLTISSSNSSSQGAKVGDEITLSFEYDLSVNTPMVSFQSNGVNIADTTIDIVGTNNTIWTAKYTVDAADQEGAVTFTVDASSIATITNATQLTENDITNGSSITVDITVPTFIDVSMNDNTTVTVTFSEDVFTNADGTGDLTTSDFSVTITGGNATFNSINSVSKTSNSVYVLNLSLSGAPNGGELVEINVASDTSIYDTAGNAMLIIAASDNINTYNLNEDPAALISSTSINSDNTELTVTFSEDVFTNSDGTGDLTASDFSVTITGGTAVLSSIDSVSKTNDSVYVLNLTYSSTATGAETITVVPASSTSIYDDVGQGMATTQTNNTATLNNTTLAHSSASISSNNTLNSSFATYYTNDVVTLTIVSEENISAATISVKSGGVSVNNSLSITSSGNTHIAQYVVSSSDTTGIITFTVDLLGLQIVETTDRSRVEVVGVGTVQTINATTSGLQLGDDIEGEVAGDNSGYSVSLSSDGSILAIGAIYNNGIGHVRVWQYSTPGVSGGSWNQLGSDIDGDSTDGQDDQFGYDVTLSSDGMIVAISERLYDDSGDVNMGRVLVYKYINSSWTQLGDYLGGIRAAEQLGYFVAISNDGSVVAAGAPYSNSYKGYTGVWLYSTPGVTGGSWTQIGLIEGTSSNVQAGTAGDLNSDGTIMAMSSVGGYSNGGNNSGKVQVYLYSTPGVTGGSWNQLGSDIFGKSGDRSGMSVSLNDDGSVIAIGSDLNDDNGSNSGEVRVWLYSTPGVTGGSWTQIGQDIEGEANTDYSGRTVSLNDDGSIVAIGAPHNNGNGDDSGHVRIWQYSTPGVTGGSWTQIGPDINGEDDEDYAPNFNTGLSLNSAGSLVAIGSTSNDDNGNSAGHVRVFETGYTMVTENTAPSIFISNVSILSNNTTSSIVATSDGNNEITLSITALYDITQPTVTFQTGGVDISGNVTVNGSGKDYTASFTADRVDNLGDVTFSITNYEHNSVAGGEITNTTDGSKVKLVGKRFVETTRASVANTQLGGDFIGIDNEDEKLGKGVAINGDGSIIAMSSPGNDEVNSSQGKVDVFEYDYVNASWNIMGSSIRPIHFGIPDTWSFGNYRSSISLDENGTTLAMFAESTSDTTVYIVIVKYDGTDWTQLGSTITLSKTIGENMNLKLNSFGHHLIVGLESNNSAYVYRYNGYYWFQLGSTITSENTYSELQFGYSVAINSTGNRILVGCNPSGSYTSNYSNIIYEYRASQWVKAHEFSLKNQGADNGWGCSVDMSSDGNTISIGGAYSPDSWPNYSTDPSTGNPVYSTGVIILQYDGSSWNQLGNKITSTNDSSWGFGTTHSLSKDGTVILVGEPDAQDESSNSNVGRVYVYQYDGSSTWNQVGSTYIGKGHIQSDNVQLAKYLGLSADGTTMMVGASGYDITGSTSDDHGLVQIFETGCGNKTIFDKIDNIIPIFNTLTLSSSQTTYSQFAEAGDTVTLSIVTDVSVNSPTVSFTTGGNNISGNVTVTGSETAWTASFVVDAADTLGVVGFTAQVSSLDNIEGLLTNTTTDNTGITVVSSSAFPPTITSLTIASNNTENTKYAGENDVVTLNIVADVSMNEPTVSFTSGGVAVTGGVTYTGSDTSWTAQYTVNSADTLGTVAFTVDTQSVALLGNTSGVQEISTTNLSEVTIVDYTTASLVPPSITTLTISSNNTESSKYAVATEIITLVIVTDININQPTVTFTSGNAAITNASAITYTGSDNSWTAQYTVDAADTVGEIGFTVDCSSALTSTSGNQATSSTDGNVVNVVASVPPAVSTLTISSNNSVKTTVAAVDDVVTLALVTDININQPTVTFTSGGVAVTGSITYTGSDNSWTAQYTVDSGDTAGEIGFTVDYSSASSSTSGPQVTSATDGKSVNVILHTSMNITVTTVTSPGLQLGDDIVGKVSGDNLGEEPENISLSSDGTIIAVASPYNDDNGDNSGHVRVFKYSNSSWTQLGDDIVGEAASDYSGHSCSLSSDGSIVAIGGWFSSSGGYRRGTLRVWLYSTPGVTGGAWTQLGADIDGEANSDYSGKSNSISSDGSIVAIGAPEADTNGHVRVWKYSTPGVTGGDWSQLGGDIVGEGNNDQSGESVSLSSDGSIVAIGAFYNDSNGNNSGHVRVWQYSNPDMTTGGSWAQIGGDIDGEDDNDRFGYSVSLNSDGTIMAVGAIYNSPTDVDGTGGHVRVYQYSNLVWTQIGPDIDGEGTGEQFGYRVQISDDGSIVAAGGPYNDNNGNDSGIVRVYQYNNSNWTKLADIVGEGDSDYSGTSVSLSSDGSIVAIGAENNDSNGSNAGHVRVFETGASSINEQTINVTQIPPELTNLTVSTSNSNSSLAVTNDMITINLETDVSLSQIPSFQLKSAGIDLSGNVEIIGSDFNWVANYIVEEEATNGAFTFVIDVSGTEYADNQFTEENITNGSSVSIVTSPIPRISSVSVSNNNNARITFSEDVYTTSAGAGDLQVTDFELTILTGYATLSSSTPLAITKNSGTEYDLSFSAVVGDGHSDILVDVANDSSIFNLNGLPLDAGYASNNIAFLGDNFISNLSLSSNSIYNSKYAQPGDIVNLDIKALKPILQPTVVFKSDNESVNNSVVYTGSDVSWNASYTVHTNDTSGNVTFTINYTDLESNSGIESSSTTDNTSVTIVPDILQVTPALVGLTHTYTQSANNQGKNYVSTGDSYVIYAEFIETLGSLPVIDISIGGNSIAQSGYIMDTLTQYTNPVAEQYNGSNDKQYRWNFDIEQYMGDGDITYTIDVSYSYITVTHTNDEITDSSVFTSVRNGPIYESVVLVGLDGVRATFNKDVFTESDGTGDLVINTFEFAQYENSGSVYLNSLYPTSVTKVTNSIYDLSYDAVGIENNTSAFLLAVYKRTAALIYDASGLLFTTPYKGSAFLYDSTVVSLTSVSIASDNSSKTMFASYYTNDTVTLSFTSSESLYGTPVVSFTAGGADISGNVTVSGSGTTWTASYLVDQVDTLGLVGFTIDFTDGYNSRQVTATTDNSKVTTVGTFTGEIETTVTTTTTSNLQIGGDIDDFGIGSSCVLNSDGTIVAAGAASDTGNGSNSGSIKVYKYDGSSWNKLGDDIDGERNAGGSTGYFIAMSDDGSVVASGEPFYNNSANPGRVRVWLYSTPGVTGGTWTQIGSDLTENYSNWSTFDYYGRSVALSSDGTILAAGATRANSYAGIVNVWKYSTPGLTGGTWTQLGSTFTASSSQSLGSSCSLSDDGSILAVGLSGSDGDGSDQGTVQVWKYSNSDMTTGGYWQQMGDNINGNNSDFIGGSVSLSSDGSVLATGSINYYIASVFVYSTPGVTGGSWTQIGDDITVSNRSAGTHVSLSGIGNTLAISGNESNAWSQSNQGIDDDDTFAKVYTYSNSDMTTGGSWSIIGNDYLETNIVNNGTYVSLNGDGTRIAVSHDVKDDVKVFETGVSIYTTVTQVATVPAIPPVISSLGILSNNTLSTSHATDGNTITVSMTYDENLTQSPTVTFQSGGLDVALSTTISGSDATYTAEYVVDPNDTQGDVTFVIDASGTLADTNDTQLEITDGSSMEMLDSPPTFSSVTNEINKNISIEFSTDVYNTNTVSGDLETSDFVLAVESGDVTLTSTTPSAISKVSNKIYDLSFSLTETITTNVPVVSINPVDSTSIYNSVGFAMIAPQTTDNSFNLIDRVPPSLTSVSISSNNTFKTKYASYFAPDTVTLTLTASENINQPVVTFTVDDVPVTDTINYSGSGASWTVSFVVTSSTPLGNLSFSIDYTDTTDGNAGTTVTSSTDATKMIIVGAVVTSTSTVQSDNFEQYGQTLFGPASSGDRYFDSSDINNDGTIMVTSNQYTLDPVFGDNLYNVVVYEFDGSSWTQKGSSLYQSSTSLASENSGDNNTFGSVSINSAGDIIAIGESGYETLTQFNNSIYSYGAVHIFQYDGNDWIQMGNSIVGSTNNTAFGTNVKLSSDGLTLFSSSSNYPNNSYNGKVEIYTYNSSNTTWELKGNAIEGEQSGEKFATFSIDITSNGLTFAASSFMYKNAEDVIVGKAQVYTYNAVDNSFNQVGQTLYGTDANNKILYIALSDDGTVLATARSLDDTPENNAGTVIVYKYDGASWNQIGQTIYGTNASDTLGWQGGIACNADGSQILIGARTDENYTDTGSVSLYEYDGTNWNIVSILHGTRQNQLVNYFITNNSFEYLLTYYSQYAPDGTNRDGILETFKRPATTVNQGYVLYPPDATVVTVDSNGAHGTSVGVGETVSISIDFDNVVYDLSNISILIDDVSINNPFTITPDPPATSFTISFVISESDPSGNITFSMDASGALGVNTITHNLITDGSSMETDFTLPVFIGSLSTSTQLNNFDPTYLQGFLDISGAGIRMQNDSKLFIGGDVSLAGNMFIDSANPVKINTTENIAGYSLDVSGNTDLSGNVTIAGDIDVSGNVVGIVNYNTINKDIPPISNSAIDYSDSTDETALPVGIKVMTSDNSFNSTTATIHNDLSANGNFGSTFIFDNSLSVAGSVLVSDLSQNSYGAYTIYSKKDSTDSFMVGKSASNVFTIVNQSNVGVFMNSGSNILTSTSDKNLKTNISNLENNSDNIMKLRPVEFNWNYEEDNKKKHVGFIAQEVEEIFPELVEENVYPNGEVYKGVNTNKLIPYMIDEIKLLEEKLEKLEKIK